MGIVLQVIVYNLKLQFIEFVHCSQLKQLNNMSMRIFVNTQL